MARTAAPSSKKKKKKGPENHNKENEQTPKKDSQKKKMKRNKPPPSSPQKRRKASQSKYYPMPNTNDLEALPFPDAAEILVTIEKEEDRHLQTLLWEIDCHYVLIPHQYKGVRAIAGVPEDFPGSTPPPTSVEALQEWVIQRLQKVPERQDRGILMADVMGLGKTVQSVAACMLRNAIALAKDRPKKPTLIVSPNDAVLLQWQETLIKANVNPNAIFRFQAKKSNQPLKHHQFFLCNRYDLQTEARHVFSKLGKDSTFAKSPLFPNARKSLLRCLNNQYLAEQGKAKNWLKAVAEQQENREKLNIHEAVTKSLTKYVGDIETVFETVVIDEAHFLKNLAAYWGMAAGLLGLHTNRMIPMSGTPYNNSCQDVATLMTMIDARLPSAREKWWKKATTRSTGAKEVQEAIQDWSENYLVRRDKDVIAAQLPKKSIRKKHVGPLPLELAVYEMYEGKFLAILQKFQRLEQQRLNLHQRQQMKLYFELMLAYASCMRCALIHPLLAGGGRDFTILFSPSRRSLARHHEKPHKCVCCKRNTRKEKKQKAKQDQSTLGDFDGEFEGEDEDDVNSLVDFIVNDDVVEWEDSDDDHDENEEYTPPGDRKPKAKKTKVKKDKDTVKKVKVKKAKEEADYDSEAEEPRKIVLRPAVESQYGEGEIVPIPASICPIADHGLRHFACESCLETMTDCPACTTAQSRLRLEDGRNELMKKRMEAEGMGDDSAEDMEIPRTLYCQDIFGGFRASAKLESIIEDYRKLPKDDKVLICSFFKGSLDLLEAIFHDMGVGTARFDGDVGSEERQMALDSFKEEEKCRVLLMTVQTGGTGLNLVNANHVWFVDRFWNPMVMEQAEDRCYRMGQTKDVYVTYHDVNYTTDDVMRHINEAKSENAKIILANGSTLSTSTSGMSFKDISGQLGDSVRAIRDARMAFVTSNKRHIYEPMPPSAEGIFDSMERGSPTLSKFASLMDAISNMLGYASNTTAPQATAPTELPSNSSGATGSIPMDTEDTKPDQTKSESSKPDGSDGKEKKTLVMPPRQTKSEANAGSGSSMDLINLLDDEEDSKNPAPINTNVAAVKPEQDRVNLITPTGETEQEKPKSWLDDDSDDDSVLEAIGFKSTKNQKSQK